MGLEPTIPGLGDRCLIHWATRADNLNELASFWNQSGFFVALQSVTKFEDYIYYEKNFEY